MHRLFNLFSISGIFAAIFALAAPVVAFAVTAFHDAFPAVAHEPHIDPPERERVGLLARVKTRQFAARRFARVGDERNRSGLSMAFIAA